MADPEGLPPHEFVFWNVVGVPDLLRDEATVARRGFERLQQPARLVVVAEGELVMGAFAHHQGPGPADPRAVEGRTVLVFAIAVIVVAMPERPLGKLDLQQMIDGLDGIEDARVIGGPQTEAHQSERVGADHRRSRVGLVGQWNVPDRHGALQRMRNLDGFGR